MLYAVVTGHPAPQIMQVTKVKRKLWKKEAKKGTPWFPKDQEPLQFKVLPCSCLTMDMFMFWGSKKPKMGHSILVSDREEVT